MGHGITRRDVVLAVGTTAWHGLALKMDGPFGLDRVEKDPAFNFGVVLAPSGVQLPDGEWLAVGEDRYTLRVDPDGAASPLGRVSDEYTPFDQASALEVARRLEKDLGGALRFDTAGTLVGGGRCWLQAKIEDQDFVVKSKLGVAFPHAGRFLYLWGHDGKTSVILKGTMVCIVCWNTSEVAMGESGSSEVRIAHTASVDERVRAAAAYLAKLPEAFAEDHHILQTLANQPMGLEEFEEMAAALLLGVETIDDPRERREAIAQALNEKRPQSEGGKAATTRALTMFEKSLDEYRAEFLRRADEDGAGRTLFAAESAVTALVDHPTAIQEWLADRKASYRASVEVAQRLSRTAERALIGSGAALKRRARATLLRRLR